MAWNGLHHIQTRGGVRVERPAAPPEERGYMTGATSRVLACPECGSIDVSRMYDLGTGALYPRARGRYHCERDHAFDEPDHGYISTYSSDPIS